MGITRLDRVRNKLGIEPLIDKIEWPLRWFQYLIRMKNAMPVKKVWEAKTQQKREEADQPEYDVKA